MRDAGAMFAQRGERAFTDGGIDAVGDGSARRHSKRSTGKQRTAEQIAAVERGGKQRHG